MMLKSLWKKRLDWDQCITEDVQHQWRKWLRELTEMSAFSVPRAYGLHPEKMYQLHVFTDASQDAFAAVVYLRTVNSDPLAKTALLICKSRLAPDHGATIPRLELTAALIGARLLSYVKRQLTLPPQAAFLWTDSTVVLHWIRSDARRWGVYVKNRIAEIQELTSEDSWRHCPRF